MARTLTVELTITVSNDEQAEKIYDAVTSGLAETAIKDRVLYGMPIFHPEPAPEVVALPEAKVVESTPAFTPLSVGSPTITVLKEAPPKPEVKKKKGVFGRGRFARTGG